LIVSALSTLAVSFGIRYLPLHEVVIFALLVFALVFFAVKSWLGWRLLSEIRFDYLPQSPLENGWRRAYGELGTNPRWSNPADAPVAGSISIEIPSGCAIETSVTPNATVAIRLVYSANYSNETMFFIKVELSSQDGRTTVQKWMKLVVGERDPFPTGNYETMEWTLPLRGKALRNGWRTFDVVLPDAVRRTWGTLGFKFRRIIVVRIRAKTEVSPLQFYEGLWHRATKTRS